MGQGLIRWAPPRPTDRLDQGGRQRQQQRRGGRGWLRPGREPLQRCPCLLEEVPVTQEERRPPVLAGGLFGAQQSGGVTEVHPQIPQPGHCEAVLLTRGIDDPVEAAGARPGQDVHRDAAVPGLTQQSAPEPLPVAGGAELIDLAATAPDPHRQAHPTTHRQRQPEFPVRSLR